jgi:hypothetical protein
MIISGEKYCSAHRYDCDDDDCRMPRLPVCVRAAADRCGGGSTVVMRRVPASTAPKLKFVKPEPTKLSSTTCKNNQQETFCQTSEWESNAWTGIKYL